MQFLINRVLARGWIPANGRRGTASDASTEGF
jgi:hypothetical protein